MQHEIPEEKECPNCRTIKSSEEFHRNSARKDGLTYVCAECIPKYEARAKKAKKNLSNLEKTCSSCNRILSSRMYVYDQNTEDKLRNSCRTCSCFKQGVPSPSEIEHYESSIKSFMIEGLKSLDIEKNRSEFEHFVWKKMIISGLSNKWKQPIWVHKTSISE